MQPAFIINFHGIGKALRTYGTGEEPYWIDDAELESVLDFVERRLEGESIRITFDDGNRSDYTTAAPSLQKRGLRASFFVLAGRLDQKGCLTKGEVCELSEEGFEIGSHGFDHIDWTRARDEVLIRELKDSKALIEDITGRTVRRAAIPFGRYDRRVLGALSQYGYQEVFSSDGGPRLTAAWPTPRFSLRRGVGVGALANRIEASATFLCRAQSEAHLRIKTAGLIGHGFRTRVQSRERSGGE